MGRGVSDDKTLATRQTLTLVMDKVSCKCVSVCGGAESCKWFVYIYSHCQSRKNNTFLSFHCAGGPRGRAGEVTVFQRS